jgi:hypothetical protein
VRPRERQRNERHESDAADPVGDEHDMQMRGLLRRRRSLGSLAPKGVVMSGCRPLIKGFFRRCADRGCGHVFGLVRGEFDPLALMLSADPLPRSRQRA